MKTIKLTDEEVYMLSKFLECNPCNSGCVLNNRIKNCCETRDDGSYRCPLLRAQESIYEKLGM